MLSGERGECIDIVDVGTGIMFFMYCMKVVVRWELVRTIVEINISECIIAVH